MNKFLSVGNNRLILRSKEYPWLNACLHFTGDETHLYAYGYKRAAEVLAEHVMINRMDLNSLVYPILYLYRQCIELQLKSLIRNGSMLLDSPRCAPNTHNLRTLWTQCKEVLSAIFDDDQSSISEIETVVLQLSEVDPHSQAFRYPEDSRGNESLAGISHVNLKAISDVLVEISGLLDGAETGISEYLSNRSLGS